VASLHRLTSLDLSQCHGVFIKALTALQGCTTLDTLSLCGLLGQQLYHDEVLQTYPSLVDDEYMYVALRDMSPLLRSLALSTLSLHDAIEMSDQDLMALALLPGLTALRLIRCYSSNTAAGLLAAREAAPHLTITYKLYDFA
jgi:hypothetical protein